MRRLRAHPFLLLGLATIALAALAAAVPALQPAARVAIIPVWLMRTVELIALRPLFEAAGPARVLVELIGLPLLFAPFLLADWLLGAMRRPPPSGGGTLPSSTRRSRGARGASSSAPADGISGRPPRTRSARRSRRDVQREPAEPPMPHDSPEVDHYGATDKRFAARLYAEVRAQAFGHDIGQTGWLSAAEQDLLIS